MKTALLLASLVVSLTIAASAKAFVISPLVQYSGQALSVTCKADESFCLDLCDQQNVCVVKEPLCRSCAGTEDLKLKRILDGVGTTVVASGNARSESELLEILKAGAFISLHSTTLYNYSDSFDGDQARAKFRSLCPALSEGSEKVGIILLGINAMDSTIKNVLGAVCPDESTDASAFYSTTSKFQAR